MDSQGQSPKYRDEQVRFFVHQIYKVPLPFILPGLTALIHSALNKLPTDEYNTIVLRYGLTDGRFKSLEEVSLLVDPPLTQQAICKRLAHAIRRLRSRGWATNIRTYLNYLRDKGIS